MKNGTLNKMVVKSLPPLLLSFLFTACTSNAAEKGDKPALKRLTDTKAQEIAIQKNADNPVSKMTKGEQVEHCKQSLAKKLNLGVDKVELLTTRPVTWRSGALGCPEEGVSYTQALVPGRIIVLSAGEQVYRYHTAVNETPFFCPNSRAESPKIHQGDL